MVFISSNLSPKMLCLFSCFVYALALSGEKATNAIKALKSATVVRGVPWAHKTNNDTSCASQQFNKFLGSWKIFSYHWYPLQSKGDESLLRGPAEPLRSY